MIVSQVADERKAREEASQGMVDAIAEATKRVDELE